MRNLTSELIDKTLKSAPGLDGSPLALLLPYEAGERTHEMIALGLKQLEHSASKLFILISPLRDKKNHKILDKGCKILMQDNIRIPRGELTIDQINANLLRRKISAEQSKKENEFLVDLYPILLFLAQVRPNSKIVAIMIGSSEIELARELGKVITTELSSQNPVLIALSKLDDASLAQAEHCDISRFFNFAKSMSKNPTHEPVYSPIISALKYANSIGGHNFTKITNQTDTKNLVDPRLNLTTAMIWNYQPPMLGRAQQNTLLKLGFTSIREYLKSGTIPEYKTDDNTLKRKSGIFITIKQNGLLKGCIGRITADEPLYRAVQKMSVAAATSDPRFAPINSEDLSQITLKIAVLSPLQRIDVKQIEVGKHGLLIDSQGRRGVLLPGVPVERGWNKQVFLAQLCKKAGLAMDVINDNPPLYGFTSIDFENSDESFMEHNII